MSNTSVPSPSNATVPSPSNATVPSPSEVPSPAPITPVPSPVEATVPSPVEAPSFSPALITPSSSTSSIDSENIILVILLVILSCTCAKFFCRKRTRKIAEYHNIDPFEVEEDLVGVTESKVQDIPGIEINERYTDNLENNVV